MLPKPQEIQEKQYGLQEQLKAIDVKEQRKTIRFDLILLEDLEEVLKTLNELQKSLDMRQKSLDEREDKVDIAQEIFDLLRGEFNLLRKKFERLKKDVMSSRRLQSVGAGIEDTASEGLVEQFLRHNSGIISFVG